jgi:hypothetical protein
MSLVTSMNLGYNQSHIDRNKIRLQTVRVVVVTVLEDCICVYLDRLDDSYSLNPLLADTLSALKVSV